MGVPEGQCLEEYELILRFILKVEERLPVRILEKIFSSLGFHFFIWEMGIVIIIMIAIIFDPKLRWQNN